MIAVINGKIVMPDGMVEGKTLLLNEERILGLSEAPGKARRIIDAQGRYVLPGFIDLHSDKVEQFIQPRPTAQMDFELALKECERELLHQGITTMYHSLSLYQDEFFGKAPLRTRQNVQRFADMVAGLHLRSHLIHHRFHLRIEIDNLEAYDIAKAMIADKKVHLLSFMDHTPGQGQYRSLEIYEKTISNYHGKEITELGMEGVIAYHKEKPTLSLRQLRELTALAHENGIPVASHDDDTAEKLRLNKAIGVDISEFPIWIDTAKEARREGLYTVVGAPNILLGGSHSGNMSAAEAVREDCADILCSDYYPPAILHSIFLMHRQHGIPLWEMVNRATLNPAKAMGIDGDYGSLQPGKKADLLIVNLLDGYPVITHVLVDGKTTARVEYRR
ncbi:MAG: phosphonate metabolism protein PhnM [Candidatus Limiplasma sp.]|nr:phosphonate metabolism protein PhnM [Candidatus Limiplasma sp.]